MKLSVYVVVTVIPSAVFMGGVKIARGVHPTVGNMNAICSDARVSVVAERGIVGGNGQQMNFQKAHQKSFHRSMSMGESVHIYTRRPIWGYYVCLEHFSSKN